MQPTLYELMSPIRQRQNGTVMVSVLFVYVFYHRRTNHEQKKWKPYDLRFWVCLIGPISSKRSLRLHFSWTELYRPAFNSREARGGRTEIRLARNRHFTAPLSPFVMKIHVDKGFVLAAWASAPFVWMEPGIGRHPLGMLRWRDPERPDCSLIKLWERKNVIPHQRRRK